MSCKFFQITFTNLCREHLLLVRSDFMVDANHFIDVYEVKNYHVSVQGIIVWR